jgi:hypothetical protein
MSLASGPSGRGDICQTLRTPPSAMLVGDWTGPYHQYPPFSDIHQIICILRRKTVSLERQYLVNMAGIQKALDAGAVPGHISNVCPLGTKGKLGSQLPRFLFKIQVLPMLTRWLSLSSGSRLA